MKNEPKTTQILRYQIFKPLIKNGFPTINSKTHVDLPIGCSILSLEPSASTGAINLWTVGGSAEKLERRYFMACRTGVELPTEILDCVHVKTISGVHLFEIPKHLVEAFAEANTGIA